VLWKYRYYKSNKDWIELLPVLNYVEYVLIDVVVFLCLYFRWKKS
jgi:hypothetical protein